MRTVIHLEDLADDVRIAAELRAPVGVAEDQHGLSPFDIVGSDEAAANDRPDTEQVEEVVSTTPVIDAIRLAAVDQVEVHLVVLDHAVEHVLAAIAVVEILGDGDADLRLTRQRTRLLDHHQPIAVLVGQRLQQHAVDDAEDGGVGADAETSVEIRPAVRSRMLRQCSRAVAKIGRERFEPADAAGVAGLFLVLFHRTAPQGLAAGLLRIHAEPDVLFRFHVDVELHFGVQSLRPARRDESTRTALPHVVSTPCAARPGRFGRRGRPGWRRPGRRPARATRHCPPASADRAARRRTRQPAARRSGPAPSRQRAR